MQLVIAEKPSVARDLARVLGVPARGKGAFRGEGHIITWCIGHLVELDEPAAHDPAWRRWRLDTLPMLPERFMLRPSGGTVAQWRVVRDLLRAREIDEVVNACDAGREGELIFRYCCDLAGRPARVQRLWVSSLTDAALRAGLARMRPGSDYDPLADAARCRSEADWLVGLNATRALTVRSPSRGQVLSIGRVQTPTLALVVARDAAIRDFVAERYDEVVGTFTTAAGAVFQASFTEDGKKVAKLAPPTAAALVARDAAGGPPRVAEVDRRVEREPPPLLFDLTSLQRTANKRYGFSARRTLDAAQALYERHKAITYPRTDSRHLPGDVRAELPGVLDALATLPSVAAHALAVRGALAGRLPRVFDDRRVGDHHAIIPTQRAPSPDRLGPEERRLYDLIVRRFLAALSPDAEIERTSVLVAVAAAAAPGLPEPPDRYLARGHRRLVAGWQEVAGIESEPQTLPPLAPGDRLDGRYQAVARTTEPPPRFTEGTLLGAMESAGKEIGDEELRLAMKDCGLGTPATRAQIIETLLARAYLERAGKLLVATPLGIDVIEKLPPQAASVASPELTGRWEARLARMARGEEGRDAFMRDIAGYVRDVVDAIRAAPAAPVAAAVTPVGACPRCTGQVVEKFKYFACGGCDFKLWKRIAGKAVSAALAGVLLRTRRTKVLPGFRSKAGKRFSAALVLDGGEVKLDFGAAPAPKPARAPPAAVATPDASCPRCKTGRIVAGRQAWGCSRWRDGCRLVVPFAAGGRRVTEAQLVALLTRGVTRRTRNGRLRLDVEADPPAVIVEPP